MKPPKDRKPKESIEEYARKLREATGAPVRILKPKKGRASITFIGEPKDEEQGDEGEESA